MMLWGDTAASFLRSRESSRSYRRREQAAAKVAASSKDDRTFDGHLESEVCMANQANARHAARLSWRDSGLRETAALALGADIGRQRFGSVTMFSVTSDFIHRCALPDPRRGEQGVAFMIN